MSDVIAELRRLYEAVPQGKWTLEPYADFAGRVIGYDIQQIGPNGGDVIEVAKREDADLIVAMHEALPALLDAVEALRWYADEDNYDPESGAPGQWWNVSAAPCDPDEWDFEVDCGSIARTALAALKRSDEG